ncbi:MAG: hypothetical protein KC656_27090, partial [Myxococcales bacterium]|nr:hypothetical protein [Myxococcales bacterium]
ACASSFWSADQRLTCATTAMRDPWGARDVQTCATSTWSQHDRLQCVVDLTAPQPRRPHEGHHGRPDPRGDGHRGPRVARY